MTVRTNAAFIGRSRAEQRRNNNLPTAMGRAGPIQRGRLIGAIDTSLRCDATPAEEAAAVAAIQLILVTGRSLAEVYGLQLVEGTPHDFQSAECSWLIRYGQGYALAMPAGTSAAVGLPSASAKRLVLPQAQSFTSEVGRITAKCLRRHLGPQIWDQTGFEQDTWAGGKRLFECRAETLEAAVHAFLRQAANRFGITRRRQLISLVRLSRVFRDALINTPGGDEAQARVMTGRMGGGGHATSFYTAGTGPALARTHAAAATAAKIDSFDRRVIERIERPLDLSIGSRFVPTDAAVAIFRERAVATLARDRRRRHLQPDLKTLHEAMLVYTWTKWAICVGGRSIKAPLLHPNKIDSESGFGFFNDKAYTQAGSAQLVRQATHRDCDQDYLLDYKARLVWVPPHVQGQLLAYEQHVERLQTSNLLPEHQRRRLAAMTAARPDRLPFFELTVDLEIKELRPGQFEKMLASATWDWPMKMNAFRHLLRSRLSGQISCEVIDALLGHWQVGQEPWSNGSALDPMLFRETLKVAYTQLLPEADWPVLHGLGN